MKFILLILLIFTLDVFAENTARPSSNNKIGHSKQSTESKENSFFYKLFNDELDSNDHSPIDNDKILSQIERLADFKKRAILSEEEFQNKKLGSYLLFQAIQKSFKGSINRVWVHTCSLDHKNALNNYIARGMKIFKTETIKI